MSLVSEEFPDEVCTKRQSDGRRGWNCSRGSLFSVWMILPLSFRFHSALRRSPSQLMSPQRGSPHTLWTTQVNYTHAMKWMLLKQEHSVCNLHKDLPLFAASRSWTVRGATVPRNIQGRFLHIFMTCTFRMCMKNSHCSFFLQANVICIVYSVNNKKSIEKVSMISLYFS